MANRLWILGAADPEMEAVEALLNECGEPVAYAVVGVDRVHSGNAQRSERAHHIVPTKGSSDYTDQANEMGHEAYPQTGTVEYWVECDGLATRRRALNDAAENIIYYRIDHHRPSDPGYGRSPSEFLSASSIGQVIAELARLGVLPESWHRDYLHAGTPGEWILRGYRGAWRVACAAEGCVRGVDVPHDLVLTAAADHCLGAAYRGECPGVDPDELMRLRAESRAKFQGRSVDEILADIELARAALIDADQITLSAIDACGDCTGCGRHIERQSDDDDFDYCECPRLADMRGCCHCGGNGSATGCGGDSGYDGPCHYRVHELPEAGTRYGISYIADGLPGPDGRIKVVCSGTPKVIEAFLKWAPTQGLVNCYGDPQRGFAGGYLQKEEK